jgi:hypothetical protein
MAYFSNQVPPHLKNFDPIILDVKERSEFYKKRKEEQEKKTPQFRNSGEIVIKKKPCPCMNNKIKQTPSS